MRSFARLLGAGLELRTKVQVPPLSRTESGWQIEGEFFEWVLSTAPWPQTAALFGCASGGVPDYDPCLTMLLRYWGEWLGRSPRVYGMEHPAGGPLRWSACENHKTGHIQPGRTIFVAHATAAFSREHWDADPGQWSALLRDEVEARWQIPPAHFDGEFTHRWRYARVPHAAEALELPPNAIYAGDALGGSRVESAWLQGVSAAERLVYRMR